MIRGKRPDIGGACRLPRNSQGGYFSGLGAFFAGYQTLTSKRRPRSWSEKPSVRKPGLARRGRAPVCGGVQSRRVRMARRKRKFVWLCGIALILQNGFVGCCATSKARVQGGAPDGVQPHFFGA